MKTTAVIPRKVEQFMGGSPCPSVGVLPTAYYTGLTHEGPSEVLLMAVLRCFLDYWPLVSSTVSMIICLVIPAGVPRTRVISGGLYLLLTQVPTDKQ